MKQGAVFRVTPTEEDAPDDAELVRAFQAGEQAAFGLLVARYRRQVVRVARGILRDVTQAEDASQEAFVKAWQGLPQFKGDSSFKTWMYRIAMNAAFDARSRESTRQRTRQEVIRSLGPEPERADVPHPIDGMIGAEELAVVREAVERLPDRQRLTLSLKVQQGLKYVEIAEVLGCPVGTVKANFHHAVQNLRKSLRPDVGRAAVDRADDDEASAASAGTWERP